MLFTNKVISMPYRPCNTGEREKLFNFCKEYYESEGYEVRTFDSGHEVFNRSASRNLAVKESENETTILIDADTIIPTYCIEESLRLLETDDCIIKPTNRTYYLKEPDNDLIEKIKNYESLDQLYFADKTFDLHIGSSWIFRNETFDRMGRFNENYLDYGFEDLDFTYKCASQLGVIYLEYDAYSFLHKISMQSSPKDVLETGRSIYESTRIIFTEKPKIVIYSKGQYFESPDEYVKKLFDGSSYET